MIQPLLSLVKVSKKFGDIAAVEELTIAVAPGEIYALIGPNGSGKTTSIKMSAGIYRPGAGIIRIDGIDITAEPERAKSAIGYIPDEPFIYERLTGREFLHLVGSLFSIPPEERRERINKLLSHFPLESIIDSYVDNYSRGNKQKLSILAALLHRPKLLLVDEPIVGLDPESAVAARGLFSNFAKEGGSVLLCTHTLSFAESIASQIGLLKNGRLVREGTLPELRNTAQKPNATLEELYLHFTKSG